MQNYPTLNDIRRTLFAVMQDALSEEEEAGKVFIVPPAQESDPELKQILVIASFSPGELTREELPAPGSFSLRRGIWSINITSLKDTNANEPWDIAEKLELAYKPYTYKRLVVNNKAVGEPCSVLCDPPYSENIGSLPDSRNGIRVVVPWSAENYN